MNLPPPALTASAIQPIQSQGLEDAMIQLSHGDAKTRREALRTLQSLGAPAFNRLTLVVRSPTFETRLWATNALIALQRRESFSTLTLLIHDEHPAIRGLTLSALTLFGRKALPYLEDAMHDPEPTIRTRTTGLLARTPELRAFIALTAALKDPHVPVREFAAKALYHFRAPMTVTALVGALSDPHVWVKDGARQSLRALGALSITALASLLDEAGTSPDVRHSAAQVLCELRLPEAAPTLVRHARDRQVEVRGLSIEGVGFLLPSLPALALVLMTAYGDADPRIRLTVIQAAARARMAESHRLLHQALNDPDAAVCDAAKQFLAAWGNPPGP